MTLTNNDRRVLREIEAAQGVADGYAAHGAAAWTAIRRLLSAGLIVYAGDGECGECDWCAGRPDPHEGPIYRLAPGTTVDP